MIAFIIEFHNEIFYSVALVFLLIFGIMMYRTTMVYNARMEILHSDYDDDSDCLKYDLLPDFGEMCNDYTKWTVKSWINYVEEKSNESRN